MLMFLASMSRDGACHEKRVVQVLLELVASGIISVDKVNLKDMIYLPAIPFFEFRASLPGTRTKAPSSTDTQRFTTPLTDLAQPQIYHDRCVGINSDQPA